MQQTVNDIRAAFLAYFQDKEHEIVSSSPLVPQNDPTLMFTNAGMVQFKNVFTGAEKRPYSRATTSQKCVRAGGKHNDLENVGYTARHHTFFEMLGNFSFGDYFKDEAIAFAWELVTKNFGLKPERLLVTVHSSDEQAAEIWKKITGFADNKIIRIPTSDNFWSMGDTGPCGPCTEIFYDHGAHIPGGPPGSPDEDGDRFIEIWNLVFMQYEQISADERVNLPSPCVDTGMGLERIAAILQGQHDNYDIDLFRSLIEQSAELTGVSPDGEHAPSHRVIADHLRCCAFLMADGVMPSNEGRGYVLRRIMRRGMRHAHLLGANEPLMHKLVPSLIALMGDAYPELKRAQALITDILDNEETRFKRTLENGLKILDEESEKVGSDKTLPGDVAFKLYDTYGFPVDLTADALRAKNIAVDMDGFESCMEQQRAQARASWSGSGDAATEKLWFDLLEEFGATDFLGYHQDVTEGQVLAIIQDSKKTLEAKEGERAHILVNQTPFYGESGGQVGDQGIMLSAEGDSFVVEDTKKPLGKLIVHDGEVTKGTLRVGEGIELRVDAKRRDAIRANHSATHLMHEALREVLGEHVSQKGSLQDDERTRFDISHPKALTPAELDKVEETVNAEIRKNNEVITRIMPVEDAMEQGAMALFGEKYDEEVRVLFMGDSAPGDNKPFSVELCGGTHVKRTGDIGLFKIVSESAVSAGVRRVEAVTGENALRYYEDQERRLEEIAVLLKVSVPDVTERVKNMLAEKKKLESEIADLRRKLVTGGSKDSASANDDVKEVGGIKLITKILPDFPAKDLKAMVDDLKKKLGSGVVALVATNEGRASLVVGVTDDLTDRVNAVELVQAGAKVLGGKGGGGRADMAQAGGPDADAANAAASAIEQAIGNG